MRLTSLNLSEPATFVADRVTVVLTFLTGVGRLNQEGRTLRVRPFSLPDF